MGDLIGDVVDSELYYVPQREFARLNSSNTDRLTVARIWADMARLNALYMIARAGSGHIGSSFSSMDVLAYLSLVEQREGKDVVFSSKGHDAPALYAMLIAQGLIAEEMLHRLRRLGGLPGHPDIGTTGLVTNTGSLGMGISKAKGMAFARRRQGRDSRFFVLTGDGELQEGQIWESLVSAANDKIAELTVIVDNNKFQSDFSIERTSSLGDLVQKFESFGWHAVRVDGHDLSEMDRCFAGLRAVTDRPKVVVADTVKGKGVSFMEGTAIDSDVEMFKYHSGAPQAAEYQRAVLEIEARLAQLLTQAALQPIEIVKSERPTVAPAPSRSVRLIPAYEKALLEAAEGNPQIVALDADLRLDMGLIGFAERYPERFLECGIAEQDMVSQAGGMALDGLLPVVHSFSCFLATRPNEQIYNNATEHTRIVYVGGLSGVLPAGPGHSHQGVREISAVGGIPGLLMVEPSCPEEVGPLLRHCLEVHAGPSFIRLASIPYETAAGAQAVPLPPIGTGRRIRAGLDATLVASGLVGVAEALKAAEILFESGTDLTVIAMPWINRVDPQWAASVASATPLLAIVDNHYKSGGLGSAFATALLDSGLRSLPRIVRFGLDDVPPSGRNDEVLDAVGLSAATIAEALRSRLFGTVG